MPGAKITALGCYVPPKVLTNQDLEKMVETTNDWIMERTGIVERHIADPNMATSDMAVEAVRAAMLQRGIDAAEIEVLIVCSVTPDMMFPSTACLVQERIGAKGAWGFDLSAACSGYIYGLTVGAHLVMAGTHKKVMVIGADTMSRIIDYTDRGTCILFGDGAGAMLIEPAAEGEGFIGALNEIDGSGADFLKMPAGGSRLPSSAQTVEDRLHYVKQEGQHVFKFAVRKMFETCRALLDRHGVNVQDVVLISHQANRRIIMATAERLGLRDDQIIINIDRYGNTTAATIPLATRDALASGLLVKGKTVLFAAVGAGMTVGANLWRWEY